MTDRPKNRKPELVALLQQITELAEKAEEIGFDLDEDYTDEVWEHATSEVSKGLTFTCESTMDGRLLVELADADHHVVKKQSYDLFDVFALSSFESSDPADRFAMIAAIKKVLAYAEGIKDPE